MADNRSFMDVVSKICEKYSDYEINDEQAVALVERAHERFLSDNEHISTESVTSSNNSEYNKVVDAICEKFNDDDIDASQAVALMEKAIDTYLN